MNNIESIINRLKDEGVQKGQAEGDLIIEEAHKKAHKIIDNAHEEARKILENAQKELKEREVSAKYALEFAANSMLHSTAVKIAEILEIALRSRVKEALSSNELVQKIISGETIDSSSLLPLLREEVSTKGAEIEFIHGKIIISSKENNFHYEISDETIIDSYKSYIREELSELLFPKKL